MLPLPIGVATVAPVSVQDSGTCTITGSVTSAEDGMPWFELLAGRPISMPLTLMVCAGECGGIVVVILPVLTSFFHPTSAVPWMPVLGSVTVTLMLPSQRNGSSGLESKGSRVV